MKHLLVTTIAAVVLVGCGRIKGEYLFYAALEGRTKDVQIFLDNGANADAEIWLQKDLPWDKGFGSTTPLHVAKTKEIAQLLVMRGANIEAIVKTGKKSAGFGQKGPYGYDFTTGDTPLHTHAVEGRKEVVKILINAGANLNAKNIFDQTPLDRAILNDHTRTADLLRKHGGKTSEELKKNITRQNLTLQHPRTND